ncbi:helix-turn-helix domain-containing protein [Stygiolobus caldivivus]|uniref:Transcriptional regulator n=1 Tax=Stygiolobus caldivivus TaxID=2824673 RepID=A0A8D5U811_9CREN|nr:helix-turn-helix transcriptional regulator [Stygiolobus caldivivus]BCU71306.1 transcriptional regulator [Stygiolobus caldivivus]
MRIIHNLSKEARTRIIELLLENRSKKELAEELGLSPSAITKFLSSATHPSDETIEKAFKIANEREKREIIDIILDDLLESLEEFIEETNIMSRKILRIKKIITHITPS